MSSWELRNACRKNIVGTIEWENTKKYNDLLQEIKAAGFIKELDPYYIVVESYGLAFSICEKKFNSEVLYVKLKAQNH